MVDGRLRGRHRGSKHGRCSLGAVERRDFIQDILGGIHEIFTVTPMYVDINKTGNNVPIRLMDHFSAACFRSAGSPEASPA